MEEHKFLQFRESFTSRNQNSERLIKIKPTYSQYQQQSNRGKTENNPTSLSQRFEKSKTISQAAFYQTTNELISNKKDKIIFSDFAIMKQKY